MKKLWNDWSGPVAFTLGWTLLLAVALLMPNVPVWADPGGGHRGGPGAGTACGGDTTCNGFESDGTTRKCRTSGTGCTSGADICNQTTNQAKCGGCACELVEACSCKLPSP